MIVNVYRKPNRQATEWEEITNVIQPITFSQRGDKELDGGSFQYYTTEKDLYPQFALYKIQIDEEVYEWHGFVKNAKLRNNLWKVTVSLVEITKVAEGEIIDGFKVTQPRTGTQKRLNEVLLRILRHTPALQPTKALYQKYRYNVADQPEGIVEALENTISPEFEFNTQTTLWEALLQIGDCFGALPKIIVVNNQYRVVYYFVNQATSTETQIDTDTNVFASGKMIDESQFNSRLSTLAENVIEE